MNEITFAAHPFLYSGIVFILFSGLIVWCGAGLMALRNGPLDEDVPATEASAGPSAEDSERPAMLPHKVDPVTPDRPSELWFASPADKLGFALASARARLKLEKRELEAKRDRAIAEDIEELLGGPVKEGDPR